MPNVTPRRSLTVAAAVVGLAAGAGAPASASSPVVGRWPAAFEPASALVEPTASELAGPWAAHEWSHRRHRLPERIEATAADLVPEGVAWDPSRGAFLVGSVRQGTVSIARADGTVETLVDDPRMIGTAGLAVDHRRGRVLVTYADLGMSDRSTPETIEKHSGLGIYDLETGEPIHLVPLGGGEGPRAANDVTVAPNGTAYVTDTYGDALYQVSPSGVAELLVHDERFDSDAFGVNGIVWHPGGFLLTARYDTGQLFKVPLDNPEQVTEVSVDGELTGADGMVLRWDGSLAVVTNSLGGSGQPALVTVRPDGRGGRLWCWGADWESATVTGSEAWPESDPTTAAATPSGIYLLSGGLDVVLGGGTTDTFVIRR